MPASTAAARHAVSRSQSLRASSQPAPMVPKPDSAVYSLAEEFPVPNTRYARAVAQYCSGGFSMYGRPSRCGTIQSPPASISRGISA